MPISSVTFCRYPRYRGRPLWRVRKELRKAREIAFKELGEQAQALGADAVVGIDIDYETVGKDGSMLMVSVSGTAVKTLR